jgi:hypothetical protein
MTIGFVIPTIKLLIEDMAVLRIVKPW